MFSFTFTPVYTPFFEWCKSFYSGRLIGRTTRLSRSPTLGMEEEMSLCEHLGDEVRYERDSENDSCQGIFLKCRKGYRDKLKNFLGRIFIFPFTGVLISLNPPFKSSTSHFLFPLKVSLFSPSSYHNLSCLQFLFLTSLVKKSRWPSHLPLRSTFPPVALLLLLLSFTPDVLFCTTVQASHWPHCLQMCPPSNTHWRSPKAPSPQNSMYQNAH